MRFCTVSGEFGGIHLAVPAIFIELLILSALIFGLSHAQQAMAPSVNLSGPYVGQKPPGLTPAIFAPGFISTDIHEFSCTMSPDGNEFYFTRRIPEKERNFIMVTRQTDKGWTTPEIAPVVGEYEGMEPTISPDGKKIFFKTWRPIPGASDASMDMWMTEKTEKGWGEPVHLEPPFNPNKSMFIAMAKSGTIYTTDITAGMGKGKIVYLPLKDGKYEDFVPLPETINKTGREIYPCIAPDESFVLFIRAYEDQSTFLMASFHKADGSWSEAKQLDLGMNKVIMPQLSPDGKYLFFTSVAGRLKGDIYWVDAKIIDKAK
jgi:Tol biopolymer transport system component